MQNQDAIAILKAQINANASRRIRDAADEISRSKILHTQYLGNRTVRQLGQEPVENAVILNNAANAIGDALMPLAKGSPLQRFDSTNQDDGVGTAKRSLLERDAIANGQSTFSRGNGEETPANDPLKGTPRGRDPLPKDYPPPFGCVPLYPAKQCIWIPQSTSPSGYQSHGSAVINQDGLELFLHCQAGVIPPENLGCDFLSPPVKWKCIDGICTQDPSGIYATQAECNAARIPANFSGGQCVGTNYSVGFTYYVYTPSGQLAAIGGGSIPGVIGAISSVSVTTFDAGFGLALAARAVGSNGNNDSPPFYVIPFAANPSAWSYNIEGVTPSGSPDNCGDRFTCP